ncbi:MAG TPA: sulfite oxidase-like oxidoreductase [Thermoanaerobaculia bacterium]|nr:sulfite oxidase-like oxidoreductase [Thermoanaerobaculia bacterium]
MDDSIRSGEERIPPGQYVSKKWPVLTYGPTPPVDLDAYRFRISGLVEREVEWTWAELQALPRTEVTADFHCVTRFSTLDNPWSGFSTREVLSHVIVAPEASHVVVHCLGGYTTNLPLEDFLSERALFADRHAGEPLAADHGGPLRLVVPHLYAWKSAKWACGIEIVAEDQRGFWEENGYHTYGDPWREQRFSFQETKNAGEVRRRARDLGLVPGQS